MRLQTQAPYIKKETKKTTTENNLQRKEKRAPGVVTTAGALHLQTLFIY